MKKILPFLIIIAVCVVYTLPFFRTGYFPTHDGEWAIVRLTEMVREIKDLQIPPRWSDYLNHGYGYPLFNFTYPLPYYAGALLKIFRFGYTDSIKMLFVISVFASATGMYFLVNKFSSNLQAVLASILYVIIPYRIVNLYVRGSLGESLSMALFPFILWAACNYIDKQDRRNLIMVSMLIAALILTHNVTAVLFFPVILLFILSAGLIHFRHKQLIHRMKIFLPVALLSLCLSAYFFIPAVFEKQYVLLGNTSLADKSGHFITIRDLLVSQWSYGTLPSFQIGIIPAILWITAILTAYFIRGRYPGEIKGLLLFSVISSAGILFLMTAYSSFLWRIPPLTWVDFPWRLLNIFSFLVCLSPIFIGNSRYMKAAFCISVTAAVILNLKIAKPQRYIIQPDSYYETNDDTTTSMKELMPVWVSETAQNRYEGKVMKYTEDTAVSDVKYNSRSIGFTVNAAKPVTIGINTIFFPEWKFSGNGQPLPVQHANPKGTIDVSVPAGTTVVSGSFTDTPVRSVSNTISLLSAAIIAVLWFTEKPSIPGYKK